MLYYGRLAHQRPIGLRGVSSYTTLPEAPSIVKAPVFNGGDWGVLGNDRYGDCTIAAVVHMLEADTVRDKNFSFKVPSDPATIGEYLKLSGGKDTGLNEADVLHVWTQVGLFGTKADGYAPGNPQDMGQLRSIIYKFGASYLGVACPAPMQEQFGNGKPFDLTGKWADREIEGGHAIPAIGYDDDFLYVVTWGKLQAATWRWVETYLEESWAVVTPADEDVNRKELQQDLGILQSE